jgi:hypothetical protein
LITNDHEPGFAATQYRDCEEKIANQNGRLPVTTSNHSRKSPARL